MNALPYLAGLATRHAWAQRRYAELQADIVEARLTARARAMERAEENHGRVREFAHDVVRGVTSRRLAGRFAARRSAQPKPYCARAAARSARTAHIAGGAR
ncbi:hypothetical protein [Actinomadura rubrisoli]|uniref:Uncharacterized protein n=1 Tax=Actinomadura rubrisoli TaxID=2530368 RepID=A0A4R5BZV7_9ACTN|nr:hypothetical protein [Actinomadura rubrisoli]TDD91020.1 hypothetical protein E1298_12445 [Actinomadura rubrisoli]